MTAVTRAASPRSRRLLDVLFVVAVLAQLVPLVLLPHIVTVDGPAHLAGASVLAYPGDPAYRHFFRIDPFPSPNVLTELLLAGLVRLLEPVTAEKVLIGGYLMALPLALRYAVRGVDRQAGWLAFLALPLAEGYLFWYGFYNLCYGLAVSLLVIGWVVRHRYSWTPGRAGVLGLLLMVSYLSHLVPFGAALVVVAVLVGAAARAELRATPVDGRDGRRLVLRRVAPPVLAALPALVLTAAFLLRGGTHQVPTFRSPGILVGGLVSLAIPVVTYDAREVVFAALTAAVLAALVLATIRRCGRTAVTGVAGALAAATGATVVLYLVAPDRLGLQYGFINDRLSLFPPLLATLWLAAQPFSARQRGASVALLLVAAVGLAALRLPVQRAYGRQVAEYETVARMVPAGSTLLALRFRTDSPPRGPVRNDHFDPLLHEAGLVAAQTRAVDVGLFSAELNYFPVRFRAGHDLRRSIDPTLRGLEQVPPLVDLAAARTPSGDRIDTVLVVSAAQARPDSAVLRQLAENYRLVYTTRPTGLVEVWRHR